MIFSKACEYGIRACIYIAQRSAMNMRSNLKDISGEIDSPEAFTAKILQQLVRKGIIDSVKGASGGFQIQSKNIKKIRLIDIVLAIDGEIRDQLCVLGLKKCSETHPCPVHFKYKFIKKDILTMLQKTTLLEMSESINDGLGFLKF